MPEATISPGVISRKTTPCAAQKEHCESLLGMYQWAEATRLNRWPQVEERFLARMWELDQRDTADHMDQRGDQHRRAGFFKDVVILLLEGSSGKKLQRGRTAPGLIFPKHSLGIAYPKTGEVEILLQAKVAGVSNSAGNRRRRSSADLDEWIKETSLKTIDLKAERARHEGQGRGPTSDLLTWLHQSKPPLSFLFLAIRVVDTKDFDRTILLANAANQMLDGFGLIVYQPNPQGTGYWALQIPAHLNLDRALSRACNSLRNLP